MTEAAKTPEAKAEKAEKPVLIQAVHGDMVHPFTAVRFETERPIKHVRDAWIDSQIEAGKLTLDV